VIAFHRIVWALLTLPILCAAQPPGTGVISGSILEVSSNDPVRKAIVTLTWQCVAGTTVAYRDLDDKTQFRQPQSVQVDHSGQFPNRGAGAGVDLRN
jgi:hypothetical protein